MALYLADGVLVPINWRHFSMKCVHELRGVGIKFPDFIFFKFIFIINTLIPWTNKILSYLKQIKPLMLWIKPSLDDNWMKARCMISIIVTSVYCTFIQLISIIAYHFDIPIWLKILIKQSFLVALYPSLDKVCKGKKRRQRRF